VVVVVGEEVQQDPLDPQDLQGPPVLPVQQDLQGPPVLPVQQGLQALPDPLVLPVPKEIDIQLIVLQISI
jgi:hypothetical protein